MEVDEPSKEATPIDESGVSSSTTVGPQTLLKSHATYRSGVSYQPGAKNNHTHEVELKMDSEGLLSVEIYSPRTLLNSIPLESESIATGDLPIFKVVQSNNSENILCVAHRTSEGLKEEFLVFQRREEMQKWIDKLNTTLFPGKKRLHRRDTDPTFNRLSPNTKRGQKVASAFEECFGGRSDSNTSIVAENSENFALRLLEAEQCQSRHTDSHVVAKVESNTEGTSDSRRCGKTPVEDYYQFQDDDSSSYDPVYSDGSSIINPPLLDVHHSRSPSIATLYSAGESSQMARLGHTNMARLSPEERKPPRDLFSQLCQEKCQREVKVRVQLDDALSIKFFTHLDQVWIKSSNSSAGLFGGDLVKRINEVEVTEESAAKNALLDCKQSQIQFTIARLPYSRLLAIDKSASEELSFKTEGTKIKWINVDHDLGLYEAVRDGKGYITHINSLHIPFGAGTTEIMSLLQNTGDEYFLVLHPKDVAEKMG